MEQEKKSLNKLSKYGMWMVFISLILFVIDFTLTKNMMLVNFGLILIIGAFLLYLFIAVKAFIANRKYQTKEFTAY